MAFLKFYTRKRQRAVIPGNLAGGYGGIIEYWIRESSGEQCMHEEWYERWQVGRTGWHESGGNRNLKKYWRATGKRVLVPLCGKSDDIL